jgi:SAM-dependent methyltransferase
VARVDPVGNRKWGSPFGTRLLRAKSTLRQAGLRIDRALFRAVPSLRGPFGLQPNNTTRRVEYPWAYHATPIQPGLHVLEIGGGLSGFQFVLDRAGCHVTNVDPGMEAHKRDWPVDERSMQRLNRAFGTSVVLRNCLLQDAHLPGDSFDLVFSISVLEHIPIGEVPETVALIYDLLKPGGRFVLTLDLFLNLVPFCSRESNEFGSNIPARLIAESAPFELEQGDRSELYGYAEFDRDRVLATLEQLMLGEYPALAQLMVLRKPPLGAADDPQGSERQARALRRETPPG